MKKTFHHGDLPPKKTKEGEPINMLTGAGFQLMHVSDIVEAVPIFQANGREFHTDIQPIFSLLQKQSKNSEIAGRLFK